MASLRLRSYEKELLDGRDIPFEDIRANMHELDLINSYLGGHAVTISGIQKFSPDEANRLSVLEIGCGGGDNLRAIRIWGEKEGLEVDLQGVDINPDCIAFAQGQLRHAGIDFICSDYRELSLHYKPDIIFSSLFCHHFCEEELHGMMQWMWNNSKKGFFINDLHRHPLAYYSIKGLTRFFSKSYMVKNDAPLSVQRGFVRKEWERLMMHAGIFHYNIQWKWAFRWLITVKK